ncbi:mechanosensitive ion channel protein MscL [Paenibacillus nanensis]|uniref:Mechanosensitive ion channel protein MscL n=1 Tax=Paenibacillus nanensis TaxID=393251 RepID=A0A3A1UXY8_9BACL|nr:mechanosensitive ion channel protein MscL [Paenibacillus nanensis]RIX53409.1 mechanosensitive ion channel protein MscL [Paenibacillus nanensis]
MHIVFDVMVDGKKTETLRPNKQKLQDIRAFMREEAVRLIRKYGSNVYVNRRFEY